MKDRVSFVPSETLSRLYMEIVSTPNEKDREILLEIKRKSQEKPVIWEDLVEEVRKKFRESANETMYSIFIFFAQRLQKNESSTRGAYSEKNGFSDENIEDISYSLDIDTRKDKFLLKRFFATLFQEFTAFLAVHDFRSRILRVYLEEGRITVERLYTFPFPDYEKIFNEEQWTEI